VSPATIVFGDERCADVAAAGGKGASLARMAALGLPVPPGFVVPAAALARALRDAGSVARLRGLLASADGDRLEGVAAEAQQIVRASALDDGLREAIAARCAELGDVPVAVRSSACSEDSEAASYAGQQETYLNVRGAESVCEHVRECWASFFAERALFYRRRKGSLDDLGMAVVVQRLVEPDRAGVLFTIDPVRGRKDQMIVEAVFGLGEAVVSGHVTPDHFVLARDGRLKRAKLAVQPYAVVRAPGGGTREQPLSPEQGAARTLDEEALRRLAEVGRELERRFGGPQDVEWAMQGDELFVLQARPVTTDV
jgi:pyruvate,water dikinase